MHDHCIAGFSIDQSVIGKRTPCPFTVCLSPFPSLDWLTPSSFSCPFCLPCDISGKVAFGWFFAGIIWNRISFIALKFCHFWWEFSFPFSRGNSSVCVCVCVCLLKVTPDLMETSWTHFFFKLQQRAAVDSSQIGWNTVEDWSAEPLIDFHLFYHFQQQTKVTVKVVHCGQVSRDRKSILCRRPQMFTCLCVIDHWVEVAEWNCFRS